MTAISSSRTRSSGTDQLNESTGAITGVLRGQLGTAIAPHQAGKKVHQLQVRYANVVSVNGTIVTLDAPAAFGVADARVWVGSRDMKVTNLEVDGARPVPGFHNALEYSLTRHLTISGSIIRNGEHGAISLEEGTTDSVIENNQLINNGDPENGQGSAIWLFQAAVGNTVRNNLIFDVGNFDVGDLGSNQGITIDDRSVAAQEWDRASSNNLIESNTIKIRRLVPDTNAAFLLSGATNNTIVANIIAPPDGSDQAVTHGVKLKTTGQGHFPIVVTGNVIRMNEFYRNHIGLQILTATANNNLTDNALFAVENPCLRETNTPGNDVTGTMHNGEQVICIVQ